MFAMVKKYQHDPVIEKRKIVLQLLVLLLRHTKGCLSWFLNHAECKLLVKDSIAEIKINTIKIKLLERESSGEFFQEIKVVRSFMFLCSWFYMCLMWKITDICLLSVWYLLLILICLLILLVIKNYIYIFLFLIINFEKLCLKTNGLIWSY